MEGMNHGGTLLDALMIGICAIGVVFFTICIIGFLGDLKRAKKQ